MLGSVRGRRPGFPGGTVHVSPSCLLWFPPQAACPVTRRAAFGALPPLTVTAHWAQGWTRGTQRGGTHTRSARTHTHRPPAPRPLHGRVSGLTASPHRVTVQTAFPLRLRSALRSSNASASYRRLASLL